MTIFLANIEKELIARGVIPADNVCVCCGERYALDGLLCNMCKNGQIDIPKKELKFLDKLKIKIKEFLK